MTDAQWLDIARFCNRFPNIDLAYDVLESDDVRAGKNVLADDWFSPPSAVDSILDKETCTVEDLFAEEKIIQECKTINNRLINFLWGKEQMQQMHKLIQRCH